jgi:PIN domain nuclease of toxin-antitoxin system
VKLLLDTHAFLWWVTGDSRLTDRARDAIADGRNEVFFSVVSAWEIVVKAGLGRLHLEDETDVFIDEQLEANALEVLPLHLRHALALASLPDLHRDPFDRMLIAQAANDDLTVVSADRQVAAYSVPILW